MGSQPVCIHPGPGDPGRRNPGIWGRGVSQRAHACLVAGFALTLTAVGVLMIYSTGSAMGASKFGDPAYFLRRQLLGLAVGLLAFWFCATRLPRVWERNSRALLIGTLVLLVLVLFLGSRFNGARRWIRVFGTGFQPSELAKLAVVVHTATFLARDPKGIGSFREGFVPAMAPVALLCALTLAEPDFGTSLFLGSLGLMVLIVGGLRLSHLVLTGALMLPAVTVVMGAKFDYIRHRLSFFYNGEAAYQVEQAFLALGSGGLWGRGLGAGTGKLFFLPEVVGDFIFPAIGEEIGFAGVAAVILLFAAFTVCGFRIARRALDHDRFSFLLAVGITGWISIQAITNLAVVSGTVPTKGIALPFISFGSSSLVVSLAAAGILVSIARANHRRRRIEFLRTGP